MHRHMHTWVLRSTPFSPEEHKLLQHKVLMWETEDEAMRQECEQKPDHGRQGGTIYLLKLLPTIYLKALKNRLYLFQWFKVYRKKYKWEI